MRYLNCLPSILPRCVVLAAAAMASAAEGAGAGAGAGAPLVLLVHGGAGDVADEGVPRKLAGVRRAAQAGYEVLRGGGAALDAAVAAVHVMEDDDAFNAGYGSVLNVDGEVEMDALVMDGKTLNAGAVGVIPDVRHPIDAARLVMECAPHVLLVGEAAKRFAVARGVEAAPPGALVTPRAQAALRQAVERGDYTMHDTGGSTVGAVAIDSRGHLASATSTGGTSGKMVGRVGDTPLVGCGGYADDTVGTVSTTGHGESIIKTNLAHSIIVLMRQGLSAQDATQRALDELGRRLNNTAGAITLSNKGDVGVAFISKRMSWAYRKGNEMHYGIDPDQHCVEIVQEKENK